MTATTTRTYLPRQPEPDRLFPIDHTPGLPIVFIAVSPDPRVPGLALIRRGGDGTLIEHEWPLATFGELDAAAAELCALLDGALIVALDPTPTVRYLSRVIMFASSTTVAPWSRRIFDVTFAAAAVVQRRPPFGPDVIQELLTDRLGPVPMPTTAAEQARLTEVAYDAIYDPDRSN